MGTIIRTMTIKKNGNEISISGLINEYADFTNIFDGIIDYCVINMEQIFRVNLCGFRNWIDALQSTNISIDYINCPTVVMELINMIPAFMKENTKIKSIYARYYCPDCDLEKYFLLDDKLNFPDSNNVIIPKYFCDCGCFFEFDEIEDEYFMFLKNNKNKFNK